MESSVGIRRLIPGAAMTKMKVNKLVKGNKTTSQSANWPSWYKDKDMDWPCFGNQRSACGSLEDWVYADHWVHHHSGIIHSGIHSGIIPHSFCNHYIVGVDGNYQQCVLAD